MRKSGRKVPAHADSIAERVEFELSVRLGEPRANPNRPTWQQRKTRAAAPSRPRTRGLRFGCAKPIGQNPAESRDFLGQPWIHAGSLCVGRLRGGEGGIRTHGTLTGTPDFESGTFNRTPPPLRRAGTLAKTACSPSIDRSARRRFGTLVCQRARGVAADPTGLRTRCWRDRSIRFRGVASG